MLSGSMNSGKMMIMSIRGFWKLKDGPRQQIDYIYKENKFIFTEFTFKTNYFQLMLILSVTIKYFIFTF